VLAAVTQDGNSLEYASAETKANKDVVLAAVRPDNHALQYASAELMADTDITRVKAIRESSPY
jgi:hypothetical protein